MITYGSTLAPANDPSRPGYSSLKYQRLLRGWSQRDGVEELYKLCAANGRPDVGLTVETIRRWENGRHKPSPIYRKHLCLLYGLTADKLGLVDAMEISV